MESAEEKLDKDWEFWKHASIVGNKEGTDCNCVHSNADPLVGYPLLLFNVWALICLVVESVDKGLAVAERKLDKLGDSLFNSSGG